MFFSSVLVFFSFFLSNFSTSERSGLSHILPARPPPAPRSARVPGDGERQNKGGPAPPARPPPRTIAQGGARRRRRPGHRAAPRLRAAPDRLGGHLGRPPPPLLASAGRDLPARPRPPRSPRHAARPARDPPSPPLCVPAAPARGRPPIALSPRPAPAGAGSPSGRELPPYRCRAARLVSSRPAPLRFQVRLARAAWGGALYRPAAAQPARPLAARRPLSLPGSVVRPPAAAAAPPTPGELPLPRRPATSGAGRAGGRAPVGAAAGGARHPPSAVADATGAAAAPARGQRRALTSRVRAPCLQAQHGLGTPPAACARTYTRPQPDPTQPRRQPRSPHLGAPPTGPRVPGAAVPAPNPLP